MFGFQTACDVTNATINRVRGNDSNVVAENTSDSNSEQKVHTTTVTAVAIQEPIVLTAERVETLPPPQSSLSMDRSITRQKSWIDERVSQRNIRRKHGLDLQVVAVYSLICIFLVLAASLVYFLVVTIEGFSNGERLDQFNLLPNMLAFIILIYIEIFVLGASLFNIVIGETKKGGPEDWSFAV